MFGQSSSGSGGKIGPIADPIPTVPAEARDELVPSREPAVALLRRNDFRRAYLAIAVSVLGDAFHYIALMWVALVTAGPWD